MARSAHAYVRGSTATFYEWLDAGPARLPEGPPVWICGDCHVGNLGPLADAEGRVAVQIRDLDQTVIGNPAHDLIRLGLSLAIGGARLGPAGRHDRADAGKLIAGYEEALRRGFRRSAAARPKIVRDAAGEAARRPGGTWRMSASRGSAGHPPGQDASGP